MGNGITTVTGILSNVPDQFSLYEKFWNPYVGAGLLRHNSLIFLDRFGTCLCNKMRKLGLDTKFGKICGNVNWPRLLQIGGLEAEVSTLALTFKVLSVGSTLRRLVT